jgi:hypothetical protein
MMNWQGAWNAPSASLVLRVQHQTLPDKNYKFSFRLYNPPESQTLMRTRLTLSGVIIALASICSSSLRTCQLHDKATALLCARGDCRALIFIIDDSV